MSIFDKLDRTILRNLHMTHEVKKSIPDSIEIGTPGKQGCLKVYIDANDVENSKLKIEKALLLRAFMNQRSDQFTKQD